MGDGVEVGCAGGASWAQIVKKWSSKVDNIITKLLSLISTLFIFDKNVIMSVYQYITLIRTIISIKLIFARLLSP